MMKMTVWAAVLVLFLFTASSGRCEPITFTFAGTGTGDISGRPFTNAAFTIRALSNTDDVILVGPGVFITPVSMATIEISGVGIGTFLTSKRVFDNQNASGLGFSEGLSGGDLLDILNPGFASYDLRSAFGPVFDPNPFPVGQFNHIPLDLGSLSFSQYSNVTFTANTIPEPATLGLLGIGSLGLLGYGWRCRKRRVACPPTSGTGR